MSDKGLNIIQSDLHAEKHKEVDYEDNNEDEDEDDDEDAGEEIVCPNLERVLHSQSNIRYQMMNNKPSKGYNPFECPPSLEAAKEHGKACRVCKPPLYLKNGHKTKKIGRLSLSSLSQFQQSELNHSQDDIQNQNMGVSKKSEGNQIDKRLFCDLEVNENCQIVLQKEKKTLDEKAENATPRKCPCCGYIIENTPLPLNCENTEFLHLGMSYPLYFDFIKQCIFLFLIHFLVSSIPSIIINVQQDQCSQFEKASFVCSLTFLNLLDNTEGNSTKNIRRENIFNMVFLVISMFLISSFKISQKIKKRRLETYHCSISDFSVFLTKLPSTFDINDLQDFLHAKLVQRYPTLSHLQSLPIVKSYKLYDLKRYARLYKTKIDLHKKKILVNKLQIKLMSELKAFPSNKRAQKDQENIPLPSNDNRQQNKRVLQAPLNSESIVSSDSKSFYLPPEADKPLQKLMSRLNSARSEQKHINETLIKINNELLNYETSMARESEGKNLEGGVFKFSRRAIITFDEFEVARKVVRSFKMTFKEKFFLNFRFLFPKLSQVILKDYYFQNTLIDVKKAPEPTDILWTNIGSTRHKMKFVILSQSLVYFVMLASFLVLLFLKKSIKETQDSQSQVVSLLLSFGSSTTVALFNTLIGIVIRKSAHLEEHNVQTKYFVSVGKKLTKMFIANMVLSTLLSNTVYYFISAKKEFPFDAEGLMNDFFFLFITNSYIGSIFNIFDIVWGFRLLKRARANKDCSTMTQMEANSLFEGHPIDMALRYANINKTVLFTASVSPFIPIGVPLSIIGLCITYWVDKYLLLRRYVCKNYLSYALAKRMLNGFKIYTVYFSFGNMLTMFMPVSFEQSNDPTINHFVWPDSHKSVYFYLSILGFLVALVFRYFPLKGLSFIYYRLYREQYKPKRITLKYLELKQKGDLVEDYDYFHPVLKVYKSPNSVNSPNSPIKNDIEPEIENKPQKRSKFSKMFKSIQINLDTRR